MVTSPNGDTPTESPWNVDHRLPCVQMLPSEMFSPPAYNWCHVFIEGQSSIKG